MTSPSRWGPSAVAATVGALLAGAITAVVPARGADPVVDPRVTSAFAAGDCSRCHEIPVAGVPKLTRIDSCKDCHIWIRAVAADPIKREKAMAVFPLWARYEKNVRTYLDTPHLDAAMARLEPEWLRGYLADPHDLRPLLPETMPKMALSAEQIDAIVDAFAAAKVAVPAAPAPDPSRLERGRELFMSRGCAGCHDYGGRHVFGAAPLAPDLAHARDRMSPDAIYAWIADPAAVSAGALMPTLALPPDEVLALRDYVLLAEPKWVDKPAAAGPDPIATKAPVTYAQVEERVFGRICQHCHMNPALNQGRAGPGNAGGFGYPATGIELQTYEGVVAAKDKIGPSLLRRRAEAHRDDVAPGERPPPLTRPTVPGMPLGLPALSDDDISLVLGWIEQGCPR